MSDLKSHLKYLLEVKRERQTYNRFAYFFPDDDIHDFPGVNHNTIPARHKYPKHIEFFEMGKEYPERLFMAANGAGKSFAGGYEDTCHLTGLYPHWWKGRKFDHPVKWWCIGPNTKVTRDAIQVTLLGSRANPGTGMIPKDKIKQTRMKPGTPDAIETILVEHSTDGVVDGMSEVTFKSCEEEVSSLSGAAIDGIHWDEEPPFGHYLEGLARVFRTGGLMYITFTPDKGLSDTILTFFPTGLVKSGAAGTRYVVECELTSIPHFTDKEKKFLFDSLPPHLREAKFYGRPYAASGLVYPVYRGNFEVSPHRIPREWPRAFGMDVGWNKTACLWGAYDPENDIWYIYDEYYVGHLSPAQHAPAILRHGKWIPGVVDYHSRAHINSMMSQYDEYLSLGLEILPSMTKTDVETGIKAVYSRLTTGRLRFWSTLSHTWTEIQTYRYDDGKIVKKNEFHLMDCLRYLIENGQSVMKAMDDDYEGTGFIDSIGPTKHRGVF